MCSIKINSYEKDNITCCHSSIAIPVHHIHLVFFTWCIWLSGMCYVKTISCICFYLLANDPMASTHDNGWITHKWIPNTYSCIGFSWDYITGMVLGLSLFFLNKYYEGILFFITIKFLKLCQIQQNHLAQSISQHCNNILMGLLQDRVMVGMVSNTFWLPYLLRCGNQYFVLTKVLVV